MVAVFGFRGGERLGPALPRSAARAAWIERLLELVRVRQAGVRLAGRGHGFVDRAAEWKRIEGDLGVGAERPADLFEGIGAARRAGVSHGKEGAVAGAHADGRGAGCEEHPLRPGFAPRLLAPGPLAGVPGNAGTRPRSGEDRLAASGALRRSVADRQGQGEAGDAE